MVAGDDKIYNEILFHVGNYGKFQKFFNYLFNFWSVVFTSMAMFNIVLILAIPDHWCYVPGRNNTNYTLEEWKSLTIPWKNSSFGNKFYDKCHMYDEEKNIIGCQSGWEYDKTWYTETVPSHQNWVCDDTIKATNAFAVSRIGEIFGALFFGPLGDRFGRKPAFIASILILFLGRIITAFSTSIYWLFLLSFAIGNLPGLTVFQAPLILGIEISTDEKRTFITFLQSIAWSVGLSILPFVFWACRHWYTFLIFTTIPAILFVFLNKFMIESPRWLASVGRVKKCYKELKKIAKVNKCTIPDNCLNELNKFAECNNDKNKSTNFLNLFENLQITRITLVSMSGWMVYILVYVTLSLNVTNLEGNPFVNFFLQSIAELPGYWLGKILCDFCGRKLTRVGSFLITGLGCLLLIFFIKDPKYFLIVSIISSFLKAASSISYYVINLQTLELFPTNLRQTGTSISTDMGFIAGLASPYVIYLGTQIDARYPYLILTIVTLAGAILSIFLPETKNQSLPENIEEVSTFLKSQSIWSFSVKSYNKCATIDVETKKTLDK